jgi:hypothetical protein
MDPWAVVWWFETRRSRHRKDRDLDLGRGLAGCLLGKQVSAAFAAKALTHPVMALAPRASVRLVVMSLPPWSHQILLRSDLTLIIVRLLVPEEQGRWTQVPLPCVGMLEHGAVRLGGGPSRSTHK